MIKTIDIEIIFPELQVKEFEDVNIRTVPVYDFKLPENIVRRMVDHINLNQVNKPILKFTYNEKIYYIQIKEFNPEQEITNEESLEKQAETIIKLGFEFYKNILQNPDILPELPPTNI